MQTDRALLWRRDDTDGFEWCRVCLEGDRLSAHGVQVGVDPEQYRLDYRIDTHPGFVTRSVHARIEGAGWSRRLDLHRDDDGGWRTGDGVVHAVNGAYDVDLGFSPLTNTLPVLRLGSAGGDVLVAWVRVPELTVEPMQQRYDNHRPGTVRFSTGTFATELSLDDDGFVRHYPDLATLVVR
ncbi:MAG TPA: putative glycolipid-binding domain-containing protein [Acidothermales bacterium]